jgi:hypothetical protein
MAYGLQVFNSSGQSILDTTSDKQGIGQVSGSAAISTNSSGVGNSSAISFPGMTTSNSATYDVFLYGDNHTGNNLSDIGITRGTDDFTINITGSTPSSTITVKYVGLEV